MILRCLAILLVAVAQSHAAIAFVQCRNNYPYAAVSITTSAGNALVVVTSYAAANRNDTITDGSSSYVHAVNVNKTVNGTATGIDMSYALNVSAGAKTVQIVAGSGDDIGITVCEFSGVVSFATSSSTYTNGTPTTTPTMAAFTTTDTGLVVVAYANETDGSEVTAGSGYTIDANRNSGHYDGTQYDVDVAPGSQTPSFGVTSNASWVMGAMAFSAGSSAAAPAPRRRVLTIQ